MSRTLLVATITALAAGLPAAASPSAAALAADWKQHAQARAAYANIQVWLGDEDFQQLAEGEVVRRLVPGEENLAAVGVAWVPAEPVQVWVAIQDVEDRPINKDQSITRRLAQDTLVRRLNYNLVDSPWPITDRQSVCTVTANLPLWNATGQQTWERALALEDPSLAPSPDPEAIWLEKLEGGFLISEAAGGSIVVFEVNTDPGGSVPADLVSRFAWVGLKSSMEAIAQYASEVPHHYHGGHTPVALPDGTLLQPGSLAN